VGGTSKNRPAGPAKSVNWESLHRRLEAARTGVLRERTPDEEKGILGRRARALAQQPHQERSQAGIAVIEFLLGYETYAIELSWIAETCPLKDLTPIPGTPPFVLGIINVRGRIMSVLDIRVLFDLPPKGLTDLNKVIILHGGGMEFGILADDIIGTRSIPLDQIQSSLPTLTGIREEYLRGVTRERTAILDGGRLLADRNLKINDEG